jgi:integrase
LLLHVLHEVGHGDGEFAVRVLGARPACRKNRLDLHVLPVCGPALEAAVLEGKLVRNVARLVKSPEHTPRERETWSKAEVRKFLGKASPDRLSVAWRRRFMACAAVRCSACAGRISICGPGRSVNQARVLVEYRVCIEEPKSRNGKRTLPLYAELVTALTVLHRRQLEESTIAGEAYGSGVDELDWYQGGEYVITDAVGTPVHPQWYSDEFNRLLRRAGLRRITLHDSRHMTLTLMEHAGVPISIISKWAGHYDSAFTQKTYVHASEEDLQRGQAALARIHKIA